jgi:DNA-binding Xre family transcriptional regulator
MPSNWTLKKWLAIEHDIYRASDLRQRIIERTGVQLSLSSVSELLRQTPKVVKLSTMQILCTTFQCQLSDFLEVTPGKARSGRPRRPYASHAGKRTRKPTMFPSPDDFIPPTQRRKP